jgi:hypothetical protein
MIRANARSRLREADMHLVLLLLARGDACRRQRLTARYEREGPDPLLDDPDLPARLLAARTLMIPSAPLFVYVMVRHAMLGAGFASRELADYLAALVLDFGARDRARRIAEHDEWTYEYLVDLVAELERSAGARRFQVGAHLGNYALWLAGIFPDRIAAQRLRRGGPDVDYYDALGRRGFALASGHALAEASGLAPVLSSAAERFPAIRVTLNTLSDQLFFPNVITADRRFRDAVRLDRH